MWRRRLQTLLTADDIIEETFALLEKKGVLNNTFVVFTADNGYHLGQFRNPYDKRMLYEMDIRLPLYVYSPEKDFVGKNYDTLVHTTDIGPTFLDLAGIPDNATLDGSSWAPLVSNKVGNSID